jgi:hypothetical protein
MKRLITFAAILILVLGISLLAMGQEQQQPVTPPVQHGPGFVDENGDGFNDNAPDHDGDGIPNGQDPDYLGAKLRGGKNLKGFVDANGDGINDNMSKRFNGWRKGGRGGYGDGSGLRPQDGSGLGPGAVSGNCDGTGPKGKINRTGK